MQQKVFSWNEIFFVFMFFVKTLSKYAFWALSECVRVFNEADLAAKSPFWAFSKSIKHQKVLLWNTFERIIFFVNHKKKYKKQCFKIFLYLCLPTELFSGTKTSLKRSLSFCFAYGKNTYFGGNH
jgi:hypothetical protein